MTTTAPSVSDSVQYLPGVGPKRAELLGRLGVQTVRDALYLRPARYEDRSHFLPARELHLGASAVIAVTLTGVWVTKTKSGVPYTQCTGTDGIWTIKARWYRQPWLAKSFQAGQRMVLAGRTNDYPPIEFVNPEWEVLETGENGAAGVHTGRIVPIYPLTAGLGQRYVRALLYDLVDAMLPTLVDPLPPALRERHQLPSLAEAVRMLHRPGRIEEPPAALRRLAFDAALAYSLAMQRERMGRTTRVGIAFRVPHFPTEEEHSCHD